MVDVVIIVVVLLPGRRLETSMVLGHALLRVMGVAILEGLLSPLLLLVRLLGWRHLVLGLGLMLVSISLGPPKQLVMLLLLLLLLLMLLLKWRLSDYRSSILHGRTTKPGEPEAGFIESIMELRVTSMSTLSHHKLFSTALIRRPPDEVCRNPTDLCGDREALHRPHVADRDLQCG